MSRPDSPTAPGRTHAGAPRLRLLGAPSLESGDASEALPFERRHQLVAWLALKRTWVARSEVAALFWPDQEARLAAANLRKTLHRLQASQAVAALVQSQGQALRCDVDTDVARFEAALAAGHLAGALGEHTGDELLAGFDDDANEPWTGWLRFERDRLRAAWRSAALAMLEPGALGAPGNNTPEATGSGPPNAIELAARLLAVDPLDEAALAAQLRLLAQAGQVGAARQAYQTFADRLQQELGIEPGAELKALHDALGTGPRGGGSPARERVDAASALGTDDGFIGRSRELRQIADLLAQDDCALLCLIGPGGIGKTRLARRAMAQLAGGFADGATFVSLEDVPDLSEVGQRLAGELGVPLDGREAALDEVRQALAGRQLLLVLDNFEHLAGDAAWLDALHRGCPRLKVIITSRVRPLSQAVWTMPLEGLPCPEAEDEDRLEAFDAARLFVRAARRVEPALVPAAEAAAIVDICRQVEGLPLALELAASFTRVLSCAAIAAELRAGTELLQTADPTRPARQASMQVVFEQSWRHLVAAERTALVRLAVFRGGFTATAARSVAGASLPLLAALADKSLLRKDGARCHLHPLVQQFALRRLGESGDGLSGSAAAGASAAAGPGTAAAVAEAHARHFLRLVAERRPGIRHAEPQAMSEIDAELDNVRAAWRFALRHGPADLLARAAYSVMSYYDHRGRRVEGLVLLREASAGEVAAADRRVAAVIDASLAQLEVRLDHYAEAEALALRALGVAEQVHDMSTQQQVTTVLGAATARLGRLDDARRWFERASRLAERAADTTHRAATLSNLGLIERIRGRLDESLVLFRQALSVHREIDDHGGEAQCLNNLGVLHLLRSEPAAARETLLAARELAGRYGLASIRCMVEINLANVALHAADEAGARLHAQAALAAGRDAGQRAIVVEAQQVLVQLACRQGELAEARRELQAAAEGALTLERPVLRVQLVRLFAELLAAQGDEPLAIRVMAFALQEPGLVGTEREDAQASLRRWGGPAAPPAWSGPPLAELARRLAHEGPAAFAPLIAELKQGH